MSWRIARTGKAHAFDANGRPACCGRVHFSETRIPRVAERIDPCLVCMKKIDFQIRVGVSVRRARSSPRAIAN